MKPCNQLQSGFILHHSTNKGNDNGYFWVSVMKGIRMGNVLRGLPLVLGAVLFGGIAAASEPPRSGKLVGTWCDMQLPNNPESDYVLEIWSDTNGHFSYHQLVRKKDKAELGVNSYWADKRNGKWLIENGHDEYASVGQDGSLSIYDAIGLITKAMPVPANTKPDECRKQSGRKPQ